MKMMVKKGAMIVVALLLTSCATAYDAQQSSFWDDGKGFKTEEVSSNIWKIIFKGNALNDEVEIQHFTLRKAAELTLQEGFKFFTVSTSQSSRDTSLNAWSLIAGDISFDQTVETVTTVRLFEKKPENSNEVYDAVSLKEKYDAKKES